MGMIFSLLAIVAGIGSFVVAIMMAIKMFNHQQIWQGILTIICGLFALIYGWMKKDELGLGKLPLAYTVLLIVSIVANIAGGMMLAGQAGAGNGF